MIFLLHSYCEFTEHYSDHSVWDVDVDDVKELYLDFMLSEALSFNLVVNSHYLNVMDFEKLNSHLTLEEFNKKSKEWRKYLRKYNIQWFIKEKLVGVQLEYKKVYPI